MKGLAMKKTLLIVAAMVLFVPFSFATDFSPTVMTLTAPEQFQYDFTGDPLKIDFEVAGTPGAVWLILNTKGLAENIVGIRNGHLGWHYVNKVDTTIYVSQRYTVDQGENSITWDGKDQDGNLAAAGDYDYYLWAYDDQTPRQLACEYIDIGFDWQSQFTQVLEIDETGLPLPNPILYGNWPWWKSQDPAKNLPYKEFGIHYKWVIGNDPNDLTLLRTTDCAMYGDRKDSGEPGYFTYGAPALNPDDYSIFYHCSINVDAKQNTMLKWQWVEGGEAVLDETWLGWDELVWQDKGMAIGHNAQHPTCYTDYLEGNYIYVVSPGLHQKEEEWNKLRCVTFDGEVIFDKMMHEWFYPDDGNPNEYINGAFHNMATNGNYRWFLLSHTCCMHEMIDISRIIDDPDVDPEDYIIFQNANGDYWMDNGYQPDFEPAWICLHDKRSEVTRRDSIDIDQNGFNIIYTSFLGLTTFGVSTQDGTAIDVMSFADDTVSDNKFWKMGGQLVDYNSDYDGLYMGRALPPDAGAGDQVWFVAFDSVHGVISNAPVIEPGVEEAQAAFALGQNAPNPFNPTTSINFTLPEGDQVMVEIYNVSGQKVDTLVNDFMDAGKHSVVWDASGLSNGVYFYTVKSGDFSKTMKMTLLK